MFALRADIETVERGNRAEKDKNRDFVEWILRGLKGSR